MIIGERVSNEIVVSPRRVAYVSRRYIIQLPKIVGEYLHGKYVKVILIPIEGLEKKGANEEH